jgi:hypothetical protein
MVGLNFGSNPCSNPLGAEENAKAYPLFYLFFSLERKKHKFKCKGLDWLDDKSVLVTPPLQCPSASLLPNY